MDFNVHTEMTQLLLDRGAAVDIQDKSGGTPLHVAVQTNLKEIVVVLLAKGASKTVKNNVRAPRATAAARCFGLAGSQDLLRRVDALPRLSRLPLPCAPRMTRRCWICLAQATQWAWASCCASWHTSGVGWNMLFYFLLVAAVRCALSPGLRVGP